MNRYYSNSLGRFMSPDPYTASGDPSDPQIWNRYSYTRNDPANRLDPRGTVDCDPNFCVTVNGGDDDQAGGGGGGAGKGTQNIPADPSSFFLAQAFSRYYKLKATAAITGLSANCQKVLGAKMNLYNGSGSLLAKAASDTYIDGSTVADRLVSSFGLTGIGSGPAGIPLGTTVGDYLLGNGGFVAQYNATVGDQVVKQIGNQIVLGVTEGFDSVPAGLGAGVTTFQWQSAVLVHEDLHTYLGQDDTTLAGTSA